MEVKTLHECKKSFGSSVKISFSFYSDAVLPTILPVGTAPLQESHHINNNNYNK